MNMKKTMTTTLFGLCLLLAACSRDDMPNNANHDGVMRQVALSVTLPEGMTTRAGTDDGTDPAPTRCYVQMLASNGDKLPDDFSTVQQMTPNADGSFGLTVMLNPDDEYDFLFWADNDADAAAPEDLHNVPYTADGKTIAFAARAEDQRYSQSGIEVELKHVVTRVSVATTVATDIDATHTLEVSVPRCYTAYNVGTMQPLTGSGRTDFAYSGFKTAGADEPMGHFYLIGNSQTATLTLQYTANGITNTAEASNVPLNPDYHITLKGAVPNIGLADVTITATVTTDWGTTVEKDIIGYTFDGSTYTVYNAIGLKTWAEAAKSNPALNCTLAEDIDLTGFNWTPIGDNNNKYTGTFDGGDHTITGLTVTTSDRYAGLFSYLSGTVKDVTLKDVKIESNNNGSNAGGVAGWSFGGKIENCSVSGSVSGMNGFAGGVVGYQSGGFLTECSSSATVNAGNKAGGVAGATNSGAILTACYATGSVTLVSNNDIGTYFAGGVVGSNGGSCIQACYAWGSVTGSGSGTIYVGGVTGTNDVGTLTACYHAKGAVSGPDGTTGGVAGRNFKDPMFGGGIITACYWGGNGQEQGIGENQAGTTGGTEQVTDGNWSGAKDAMNTALENTGWYYDLDNDGLPVLPPTI